MKTPNTLEYTTGAYLDHIENCSACLENDTALCATGQKLQAEADACRDQARKDGVIPVVESL